MNKILYSGLRFHHHNRGSGYDLVASNSDCHISANSMLFGGMPDHSALRKIGLFLADLKTALVGLRFDLVHYYYPEDTALFSPWILRFFGKKIVFTIHLSEDIWLHQGVAARTFFLNKMCLRAADVVITLSTAQTHIFQQTFPRKFVTFVPHGFEPDQKELARRVIDERRRCRNIIVVGDNFRDHDLLHAVIADKRSALFMFHLIGFRAETKKRFEKHNNTICHGRLTTERFEDLLCSSFVMFLPLIYATANNALLEAHKFSVPAICSKVGGIEDYALESTRLIRTSDQFWEEVGKLTRLSQDEYFELCDALRRAAIQRFSWPLIVSRLNSIYNDALSNARAAQGER